MSCVKIGGRIGGVQVLTETLNRRETRFGAVVFLGEPGTVNQERVFISRLKGLDMAKFTSFEFEDDKQLIALTVEVDHSFVQDDVI